MQIIQSCEEEEVVAFLARCQSAGGGFGGGPGQLAHLAPSYAATCALLTIGGDTALNVIDRCAMHAYLRRMKDEHTGGFRMHDDGEVRNHARNERAEARMCARVERESVCVCV